MNLKILIIAFGTFLLFSNNIALAIPGIGHQFYGSVTINGSPAPDGTDVTAKINGIPVASKTTSGGKYYFTISDPYNMRSGSEISFAPGSRPAVSFTSGRPKRNVPSAWLSTTAAGSSVPLT